LESLLRVGLLGSMWAMKYGVRAIARSGGGAIVNISSNVAAQGFPGTPAYTAMKGAMNALTRQVAVDYAPANIRCNAISIGAVTGGPIAADLMENHPDAWKAVEDAHLLRVGQPGDIANAAIFLASSRSDWITATILYADGGMVGRAGHKTANPAEAER
jgi:NAD(P)-dependent dehydrogenase (short-subunit alcohol dehydrogenase family)